MSGGAQIPVRVGAIDTVAKDIKRFRLEPQSGLAMPLFSGGSHIVVTIQAGGQTFRNPYSLMGSPIDGSSYHITVLKTETSRGGSHFMHDGLKVGSALTISYPTNLFPIDQRGRKHILIAGGIGITPFIAMGEQLDLQSQPFELYYCSRNEERGAYAEYVAARFGRRVHLYRSDKGERLSLDPLLNHQPLGTHIYVCGPAGMIEWVLSSARLAGWPDESLHSERFLAPTGGESFEVRLARSARTIAVGEHQSILEAVEAAGVDAPYLCRGGACGQCETAVLSADGALCHMDHYLTQDERDSGKKIMICVSRFKGRCLVLGL
jgi:dimethylamine monooxygenase subunit B